MRCARQARPVCPSGRVLGRLLRARSHPNAPVFLEARRRHTVISRRPHSGMWSECGRHESRMLGLVSLPALVRAGLVGARRVAAGDRRAVSRLILSYLIGCFERVRAHAWRLVAALCRVWRDWRNVHCCVLTGCRSAAHSTGGVASRDVYAGICGDMWRYAGICWDIPRYNEI